jgi:hypothetical protein
MEKIEQADTEYGEFHELPLPDTFPKDGSCAAEELMRVVTVLDGKEEAPLGLHIELQERGLWPDEWEKYWGENLAEVAWTIAYEYDDVGQSQRFDEICAAFLRKSRQMRRELRKLARQRVMDMIEEVAAEHESGCCALCETMELS